MLLIKELTFFQAVRRDARVRHDPGVRRLPGLLLLRLPLPRILHTLPHLRDLRRAS